MRKKTIQEELEELEREKDEHIKKMSKKTGHSDDHVYDFDAKYETHDFEEAAKYNDDEDIDDIPESDIERMQSNLRKRFEQARKEILETKQVINNNITIQNSSSSSSSSSSSNSKSGNALFYFILIIPLLALMGVLVGGILMIVNLGATPLSQQANFVEVTSIVQSVDLQHDEEGDIYAKIKVLYVYDEKEFTCNINDYTVNSMKDVPEVGEEITLKINPNNPNEAIFPENSTFGNIMCIAFGGILALVGAAGSVSIIKMMIGKKI